MIQDEGRFGYQTLGGEKLLYLNAYLNKR